MTERGERRLEEILRDWAGEATVRSDDLWPAVRERLAYSRRPRRWPLPRTRAGWGLTVVAAVLFGTAAYAASSMTVSDVTVEEAVLQKAPDGDRIVVRVRATGSAELPWCYVTQGRSLQDGTWFDDDLTEQRTFGDVAVFTFHEDETPSGEPVDPERVPFFAACSAGTSPGGDGPGVRSDDAHVAGTAEGEPPWPTEDREFVRKDMEYRQITPPVSTLTSDGRTVEGEFGTYCWSPGRRDEDENALWCWDEQENDGIPGEDKSLTVSAGSVLAFNFGGEVKPDHTIAGAAPMAYGKLTGRAATDLRIADGGRIRLPEDMRAGEYAMGVFVSGPQGEAEYSYRIDVEREAGP